VDPLTLYTAVEHRLAPVAPLGPRLAAAGGTFDGVVATALALATLPRALCISLHHSILGSPESFDRDRPKIDYGNKP
jgi:hypothetical protein